jgi:ABC-2 type transport system ATP-binding protein
LGKDMEDAEPGFYKDIAFVFDDLHLPGDMKIKQIRFFHKELYKEAWQDEKFFKLIERFGLPEDKALKHFSRGMKMQLSLVLALSHGAKLLLLDEPTSGLDPVIRDDFLDLLLDYIQDEDNTVLVSTHILSDLEKAADYIAFIHKGRLIFMEAKDDLTEQYGMVFMNKEQFESLDSKAVIGKRKHKFGTEVLVKRDMIPPGIHVEKVGIEDIMVYMIKGERQ